jgi:hypothetical protein
MNTIDITYRIKLDEQKTEVFDFKMDAGNFDIIQAKSLDKPPAWTELGFRQCPNCPLKPEEHPHCPMALQLHQIVERFHTTSSIDEVDVEVITEHRTVTTTTALQNAISSMLGLVFPISGCPKTEGMKPLARFHVPMASEEETVFNVSGMYLLAQYFVNLKNKNGVLSFDGLIKMYEGLHVVNKAVASRLQSVTSSDSVKNAITLLDMYSSLIPMLLQDQLVEIRNFFNAYLPDDEIVAPTSNYLEQAKAFRVMPTPEEEEKDALTMAVAKLRAEKEKAVLAELVGMPEWLQQSMLRDEMSRYKPDMDKARAMQAETLKSSYQSVDVGKPEEPPKKQYSDFVLSLQLEPIEEAKAAEPEKPAFSATSPAPKPIIAKPGLGPAKFGPKEPEAEKNPDDDKPATDEGGLQMIDFKP